MDWKAFITDAYRLIESKKMMQKKELDNFLRKYNCNQNMLNIGYAIWRVNFYHPKTEIEWWKTFFREMYIFVNNLKGKPRKTIIPYGNKICSKYQDDEITKLYYYIVLEIEKK